MCYINSLTRINFYRIISLCFVLCSLLLSTQSHAELILKDIHGQDIPYSSLKGKWVVINYWAPWCQSCIDEIPDLNRLKKQNNEIEIFAVNIDRSSIEEQKEAIEQFQIKYTSLTRDSGKNLKLGPVSFVPMTFVINPLGQLSETLYGKQPYIKFEEALKRRY